jgi:methyl-accepting chemotaxis protein
MPRTTSRSHRLAMALASGALVSLVAISASLISESAWWVTSLAIGGIGIASLTHIAVAIRRAEAALSELAQAIASRSDGRTAAIPHMSMPGAIGDMARALAHMAHASATEPASRTGEPQQDTAEKDKIKAGVQTFLDESGVVVAALKRHSHSMRSSATTLTAASDTTTAQSDQAAAISQEVSSNSQAMAAAIEQLGASIREISGQTTRASGIMADTSSLAHQARSDVDAVAQMAQRISSIVDTIRNIARQTNLLALNATIEATRAGETGRGFAVVAAEVKALAQQTSQATDDVSRQIAAMQSSTAATVQSVKTITMKIADVAEMTGVIADSVGHQDAATREIASRVAATADGSRRAAGSAATVSQAAHETKEEAQVIDRMAGELAQLTQSMALTINEFVVVVGCDLDDRRKAERKTIQAPATLTHDRQTLSVRIVDLSDTGARLALTGHLPPLAQVTLGLAGRSLAARLVWQHENQAGIVFDQRVVDIAHLLPRPVRQSQAA